MTSITSSKTLTIARIDASITSSNEIESNFVLQNLPVILFNAKVDTWRASKDWHLGSNLPEEVNRINFQHLIEHFGEMTAPVYNCKSGHCITLSVADFLQTWQKYTTSTTSSTASSKVRGPPLRYMKDWHLVRDFPEYHAYDTPEPFVTDWLNDWWTLPDGRKLWATTNNIEHNNNDYRFCYMGCKGTYTGLHHDVMNSFSWSTNIIGRKLWRLFPPSETHKLYHIQFKDQLVEDTRNNMYDAKNFPNVKQAIYIEYIQQEGEIMFVPSGWHHHVHNLDDCISINHNWLNGCCINNVWEYIEEKWKATKAVISHLEEAMDEIEFVECCSKIMGADSGLTPNEVVAMLMFWKKRLMTRKDQNENEKDVNESDVKATAATAATAVTATATELHDGSEERLNCVIERCLELWPWTIKEMKPDNVNLNSIQSDNVTNDSFVAKKTTKDNKSNNPNCTT